MTPKRVITHSHDIIIENGIEIYLCRAQLDEIVIVLFGRVALII